MAVVINGTTGVSGVDGSAGTPSYQGTDSNTGIFFPAADTIAFAEGGAEAMRIDSSGTVMIGTSTNAGGRRLNVVGRIAATNSNAVDNQLLIGADAGEAFVAATYASNGSYQPLTFYTSATERMRIESGGNVLVRNNAADNNYFQLQGSQGELTLYPPRTGKDFGVLSADTGAGIIFETNGGVERGRFTSGGYFKASNSGSYISTTSTYHECYQTADSVTLYCTGYNNSYTNPVIATQVQRSANSAYGFFEAYSGLSDREFQLRGDGNGYADGTWNNNGADYAEFFESANGQALTLGATVVLDGNKIREATDQDPASAIIGVVRPKEPSKASMVVGNTAWNKWANKYLTDDFDRYIMENHEVVEWEEQVLEREAVAAVEAVVDEEGNEVSPAIPAQEAVYKTKQHSYESHNIPAGVTVPADAVRKTHDDKGNKFQHYKLNPAWDKDAEYVNRENRPEWNIIGLLGQVKILKGQPVGDRWIKMRDVSATVEEWMIR